MSLILRGLCADADLRRATDPRACVCIAAMVGMFRSLEVQDKIPLTFELPCGSAVLHVQASSISKLLVVFGGLFDGPQRGAECSHARLCKRRSTSAEAGGSDLAGRMRPALQSQAWHFCGSYVYTSCPWTHVQSYSPVPESLLVCRNAAPWRDPKRP